jgi:hypothetical protein
MSVTERAPCACGCGEIPKDKRSRFCNGHAEIYRRRKEREAEERTLDRFGRDFVRGKDSWGHLELKGNAQPNEPSYEELAAAFELLEQGPVLAGVETIDYPMQTAEEPVKSRKARSDALVPERTVLALERLAEQGMAIHYPEEMLHVGATAVRHYFAATELGRAEFNGTRLLPDESDYRTGRAPVVTTERSGW